MIAGGKSTLAARGARRPLRTEEGIAEDGAVAEPVPRARAANRLPVQRPLTRRVSPAVR